MIDLSEALALVENFHDGTDYNFDRLTPDEQEEIIAAARAYRDLLANGEWVEANDKWFGVARHPIPYMEPGWYLVSKLDPSTEEER